MTPASDARTPRAPADPASAASARAGHPAAPGATARGAEDPFLRNIVGASPRMHRVFKMVARVAPTDATVLLLGESGTGKELVARSIHLQSRRAQGPFVPVNVAAIPESLIESELFGFMRGSFTGAHADRAGLIEQATGGTLFLDEVGDMPLAAQVKLLRTLESNEVRRIGESTSRVVDVRLVAATHRDLLAEAAVGRFREDLYYRLNVVQIELPPLRERREDIGLLASYFLDRFAAQYARGKLTFSPDAAALLERYDYPGNVRELENAIEHAVTVSEGSVISSLDLPGSIRAPRQLESRAKAAAAGVAGDGAVPDVLPDAPSRDEWSLEQVERDHIARVLTRHHGNATAAAKQLGISRTTLWRKLRAFGLSRKAAES